MLSGEEALVAFREVWSQALSKHATSLAVGSEPGRRLLIAIGAEGATALSLRRSLDIDSGQLSRLLRQFDTSNVVEAAPAPHDARVRTVTLTPTGLRLLRRLQAEPGTWFRALLATLSEHEQGVLVEHLSVATGVLSSPTMQFPREE